jgi:hypothetical protein
MPNEDTWAGTVVVKLDQTDLTTLEKAAETEKLPKTEILRRALRRYAAELDSQGTPEPQPASATV